MLFCACQVSSPQSLKLHPIFTCIIAHIQPWAYRTFFLEIIILCSEAAQLLSFLTTLDIFQVLLIQEFSNSSFISMTIPTLMD